MNEERGFVIGDADDLDRIADALEGGAEVLRNRLEREKDRDDGVKDLSAAVTALCLSTDALILAVKGSAQRNRQFRWTMLSVSVLALVGVVAAVVLMLRLQGVAESNHTNNKLILSCTTPTGKCYQDEQTRTGAAVALIQEQTIRDEAATIVCARTEKTYAGLIACIHRTTA